MKMVIEQDAAALGLMNASVWMLSAQRPLSDSPIPDDEVDSYLSNHSWHDAPAQEDGYHSVLAALGYPDVEPAGQRLRRVIDERGWRSYGLLVDACNLVAARYCAGI